ncbi:MAG TPA: DUF481 domain-containing protein [Gemmatimonadaceae bacterium]|nr:DUF481 domain-containing protein [Gemmatimonadaceae bacterium]
MFLHYARRAPRFTTRLATRLAAFVLTVAAGAASLRAQGAAPGEWKLGGTVDAAYVSATGNSEVTTVSLGDKLAATRGHWTLRQSVAYVYGKTDGTESANQLTVGGRAEYRISTRFSAFAGVVYGRNPYAGYKRRVDELAGATWLAVAAPEDSLTMDAGGVLTQQDNTDGTSDRSPSARAAVTYRHIFKKNTFFSQSIEYVPNLEESGSYRLNSESAAVAPLSARVSLKLGYLVQYNSRPPDAFKTTDRLFTSGLQVSF